MAEGFDLLIKGGTLVSGRGLFAAIWPSRVKRSRPWSRAYRRAVPWRV